MNDPRLTWWIWRMNCQRLTKWTLALLHGRRYSIRLETEGAGYHAPLERVIQVNPQLFPEQSVEVQFRVTQGLLAHECGHAWFTGDWSDQSEDILQELVNMLEDERVERGIGTLYPGVAPAIRLLGDLTYAGLGKIAGDPRQQAFACCLAWRWAHSRTGEQEMVEKLGVSSAGQLLWQEIHPLVEQAWTAVDTGEVISLAREILAVLGLVPSAPCQGVLPINRDGVPRSGTKPIPLPNTPADSALGLGQGLEEDDLPVLSKSTRKLEPAPYLELEEQVASHAVRLAAALQEPRPEQSLAPHAYRGRYSFRQEMRTPDRPHLSRLETSQAARSLALYVLVDRSGSMVRFEQAVRQALMTIYLAALQVTIPIGIAFFGEDDLSASDRLLSPDQISVDQAVAEIAPFSQADPEVVKALIAGYSGWSSQEYLDWGLRKAEAELRQQPEHLRVLLILHDGDPVFRTRTFSDWELSLAHLRSLERSGVIPIGIHLGNGKVHKLHKLFSRLVCCSEGEKLADKLGNMLCSLG
jgi:hypothetical protein